MNDMLGEFTAEVDATFHAFERKGLLIDHVTIVTAAQQKQWIISERRRYDDSDILAELISAKEVLDWIEDSSSQQLPAEATLRRAIKDIGKIINRIAKIGRTQ